MRYYAHSSQGPREEWQTFADHAGGVAARAAEFLQDFGLGDIARAWGMLHDVGKVTREFQDILSGSARRFDHSAPGAKIALDQYSRCGRLLAPGVAGHHAGMADWSALEDRVRRAAEPDQAWEGLVDLPTTVIDAVTARRFGDAFACQLLARMLFSAGVDADYLDTEAYYDSVEGRGRQRGGHPTLVELCDRLTEHLDSLSADGSEMNQLRREVLDHVREAASEPQGVFTLTVPTGGGKTLSSLAFALDHALQHGLQRVIYVAPFMSIIDQTVRVFRDALGGGDFVIEHHSTFDDRQLGRDDFRDRHRLSMQNWDAPVVCTTYAQFMESLFSNRPSRCRKLHNVAGSVVILDEPQSLPLMFLRPCVAALKELARVWRTTVVQCTATPPALAEAGDDGFRGGFVAVRELAPDPRALHDRTRRRTTVHADDVVGGVQLGDVGLVRRLSEHRRVLCIVNSRRHARKLRRELDDEGAFHLSASMCPAHRQAVLEDVKTALEDRERAVRLIATPVVEAGVDIDFPVVYRALAGLESIIQSAGRCNREGELDAGDVFVFEPESTRDSRAPDDIRRRGGMSRNVLRGSEDATALDTFQAYCRLLYWVAGDELDGKQILRKIDEAGRRLEFPYEEIANDFKLLDDFQQPIVVPWGDARQQLRGLAHESSARVVARRLQPYVVQVSPRVCAKLMEARDAELFRDDEFGDRFVVLSNPDLYRQDVGLVTDQPVG